MIDPDSDVIERVRRGDVRGAIELLMRRHGAAVYRYCRSELHDAALADDVHQQVFIEAFRDLPRFARASTLRIWLFGIVRHRVLDAAKKRSRLQRHFEDSDCVDEIDLRPSPPQSIDDVRLLEVLTDSVAKLGEPARTALLLRFQQGFTFEEMAEICREKAGTLHARVARALPLLRTLIERRLGRSR